MKIEFNKPYKARIELGFFEKMAATNEIIAAKLVEAGFRAVTVQGSGGSRMAYGIWDRETMEDVDPAELDEHLRDVGPWT